jgi:hypothetical protein
MMNNEWPISIRNRAIDVALNRMLAIRLRSTEENLQRFSDFVVVESDEIYPYVMRGGRYVKTQRPRRIFAGGYFWERGHPMNRATSNFYRENGPWVDPNYRAPQTEQEMIAAQFRGYQA